MMNQSTDDQVTIHVNVLLEKLMYQLCTFHILTRMSQFIAICKRTSRCKKKDKV